MDDHERTGRRLDAAGAGGIAVAAITVLAVLRVGADAVRERSALYTPDLWETVLGAQAAATGRQLVGAWSRIGLYHPGPMWFWWAAPFTWLTDSQPWGLVLAASALAAVGLAVTFLAARSATDAIGSLVVAAVLAVGVGQLSTEGLAVPWNPTVVIVPIAAGVVCVAVVIARGTTWPAVAAVLFGTLSAQAHLGTLLIGGAIVVGAVVAWRFGDRRTVASPPRWHGSVLLLAVVLPWVPVVVDQFVETGNAEAVLAYAATGTVDERFPAEPTGPSQDLSVSSALRQLASVASLAQEDTATWAGADLVAGLHHEPSWPSTVAMAAMLVAALAAARPDRWRRGSTDQLGSWICRVGLVGLALQTVSLLRIRHEYRPYLTAGSAGVGLALWVGIGLVAVHAVRQVARERDRSPVRQTQLRTGATAVVVLGSVLAVAAYGTRIEGYDYEDRTSTATQERVAAAIDGRSAEIHVGAGSALAPALSLTSRLEASGDRVAVRGRYRSHFSDLQRTTSAAEAEVDLRVVAAGAEPPEGCAPIGTFQGAEVCLQVR